MEVEQGQVEEEWFDEINRRVPLQE